ncbi:T-box protein 12 [Caenorhabditis elegans]|uniref:T-box protein 12 n=1 Tax=Caenorhabditis elegans TaxID=6239 RepID=TBX12_CAEEL|nr:T-box protein 12 [Caenorhabditis elegans]P90971.2 RecName: Full=T-box protein 12; AltName: Full=Protein male abnormal 9 [Caenorhabditis elegans]CAB65731.1 T-box DNA binding protein [Caenorhabditis elegans]CCD73630.1 T-box protein 12 [Caenorhabditis elegans]|eukprot:NP_493750.1 T-box protein 12 [Caenorhabditis elegans]
MSKRCASDRDDKDSEPVKKPRFSIANILDEVEDEEDVEVDVEDVDDVDLSSIPSKSPERSRGRPKIGLKMKEGNLPIECKLEGSELWAKFFDLGTEMIITKSGRRMFPTVKVSFTNVILDALYYIFLDVVPVDSKRYRYIYNKSAWLTAGKAEPVPKNRYYLHPDSPFTGDQLLKHVISFEKTKLTNNEVDKTGHLILNSMHKYQPRIHIVQRQKANPLDPNKVVMSEEKHCTYTFPETQFMAVTAYQNQLITKLKIEKNPFAKGFRDPTGRSPDEMERSPGDMMLSNFYHSSALQQAMFQQCLSKTLQLNPSIMMLYQNVFPTGNSLPAAPTVPGNPAEISIKSE